MREIKFRGRDEHGDWHYGAFMGVFFDGVVAPIEYANIYDDGMANRVLPDTIGQFTGLKDSEGREIYEGDVVTLGDDPTPSAVRWNDKLACYIIVKTLILGHVYKYVRVIGNVYDSPGLLRRES